MKIGQVSLIFKAEDPAERAAYKRTLVSLMRMREGKVSAGVALDVLNRLRSISLEHPSLYDLMSLIFGGHGVRFPAEVQGEISRVLKWRRWSKLTPDSPARVFFPGPPLMP